MRYHPGLSAPGGYYVFQYDAITASIYYFSGMIYNGTEPYPTYGSYNTYGKRYSFYYAFYYKSYVAGL